MSVGLLIDKKILVIGIIMVSIGISLSLYLNSTSPVGTSGMTEEETLNLLIEQQKNQDYNTLARILIGIGFMLVLISFGARRRRKASPKKVEKKPEP
ncbi:MAG: hypothetical protein ACREAL_01040 [Nitrosopumilaceae archaeon]